MDLKGNMKVTLIAKSKHGGAVEFKGSSKADALRKFKAIYNRKGFVITYYCQGDEI